MYHPNKYNYSLLQKETINGSRKYISPDGMPLPSVTSILDATKSEEAKEALRKAGCKLPLKTKVVARAD